MTNITRVKDWLQKHSDKAYCDACIAKSVGLRGRRAVWRVSKMISDETDFRREIGVCPGCDEKRLLIRAVKYPAIKYPH